MKENSQSMSKTLYDNTGFLALLNHNTYIRSGINKPENQPTFANIAIIPPNVSIQ